MTSRSPRTTARIAALGLGAVLFATLPGCHLLEKLRKKVEEGNKAKIGDTCTVDVAACYDPTQILYCVKGKFAPFPCKGTKGCYERQNGNSTEVFCDMSGNEEGDACWSSQVVDETKTAVKRAGGQEGKGACSDDGKTMVMCEDGKIERTSCRGPKGCTRSGRDLHCDLSIAREGDPCEGNGASCREDGKALLTCKDGKSTLDRYCRGKPCTVEGTQVLCEGALAEAGDPCKGDVAACSVDLKAFLECKNDKFVQTTKCKECVVDGSTIRCK